MSLKLSGLNSGMDTESLIAELVKAKSAKKDQLEKDQKRLSWKQDSWKGLNSKIYSFYSSSLSNMRLKTDYVKKTTTSSHSAVSVITGTNAPNSVQTLKIDKMAKAGYLTGAALSNKKGTYTASTKVVDALGVKAGSSFTVNVGGESKEIKITENTTINNVVTSLREAGLNANFDETNQRFYISAKQSGKENDFTITTNNADGLDAMSKLGIASSLSADKNTKELYEKYANALVYEADGVTIDRDATVANLKDLIDEAVAKNIKDNDYAKIIEENRKAYDEKKAAYDKAVEEYADKFKAEGYLTKEVDGETVAETDVDAIQAAIDALGDKDSLSEEDLKKYEAYEEQLKAAKDLDSMESTMEDLQKVIDDALEFYTPGTDGAEGAATQKLIDAMTQQVIDTAVDYKAMLDVYANNAGKMNAVRVAGQDSVIYLNEVQYTATGNTFEINDLTITLNSTTSEEITLTTSEDTEGVYDMIKDFFKKYNELINEMDRSYNAKSSADYDMLSDEEKEAMSEDEVEEWEKKIKEGLLRRDSSLGTVFDAMKTIMLEGIEMKDGTTMYLSNFGINTAGYFNAEEFQKNAYHIDGDADDTTSSTKTDKLRAMIASDPDKVAEFFSSLSKKLYDKLDKLMASTDYSSAFTVYNDKGLKDEYDDYKEKIAAQEQKIADYEDRYYKKFSKMEVALGKLSSKQQSIASLFA